jgi:thiazole synthase
MPEPSTSDTWTLGGRTFRSRIIVGTGKYASNEQTRDALAASGAEIVTVALRRIDLSSKQTVLDAIDRSRYLLLPNTAGCYSADEAIRTLHLARELGMDELVKLEVIGDPKTLFPDNTGTVEAAQRLVKEGFKVLPYCSDDLVTCKRLQDAGCLAVMPLAAPIGSGLGIRNPHNIRLNTGIAGARQPVLMAEAMRLAVDAGRKAFLAGRMPRRDYANASSPTSQLIE